MFSLRSFKRTAKRFYLHSRREALILVYHRVTELDVDPWKLAVAPRHFAEHLEVLRRHYRVSELRRIADGLAYGRLPRQSVVITFDDGYEDNLHCVKPLLEKHDVPATFFIATGLMKNEREAWWDELEKMLLHPGVLPQVLRLSLKGEVREWNLGEGALYTEEEHEHHRSWDAWREPPPHARHALYLELYRLLQPLSAAEQRRALDELHKQIGSMPECRRTHKFIVSPEVAALADCELIEIGAHTETHPLLVALDDAAQRAEISSSKRLLEELSGRRVRSFAYPYGAYAEETISAVKSTGFDCACSTGSGLVRKNTNPYMLPRLFVFDWDGEEFDRQLFDMFYV
ncbi:polysaccharide deacetylase family protein [Pyrinomonas methylaliphatogenes]|uniref:Predicted xylanase/chitin deacetylase n=1 Tax=Pyrinomonas methylaliphatogenes TaxID=454194 RepID=A0A0B6WYB2_9BACT|nr:polysaccharide deacetylase family protein [Pyrinomonas methylaliphatogenes]CDM66258.1 predicted xylanase/chitin deacetylase [Pyrinomonas methylaliphatogenes]